MANLGHKVFVPRLYSARARRVWNRERGLLVPPGQRIALWSPRAGYRNANSLPVGLHYGGPRGTIVRVVFLVTDGAWPIPAGVTSIDMLAVGGGGYGYSFLDFGGGPGGGGGGGVTEAMAQVVVPLNTLSAVVGAGGVLSTGGISSVTLNYAPFTTLLDGGGGGDTGTPSGNGTSANGVGGTGIGGLDAGGIGSAPSGNDGGAADLGGATSGGGGGGAGANGANAALNVAGSGGNGIVPPSAPWGTDIGEGGVFGGGGGGAVAGGAVAARGTGGGAANTGGGGNGDPGAGGNAGWDGIVVFRYATP